MLDTIGNILNYLKISDGTYETLLDKTRIVMI